jgi:hypothetical protein
MLMLSEFCECAKNTEYYLSKTDNDGEYMISLLFTKETA